MSTPKRHSYPWYVSDWWNSETRAKFSPAQRGLFRDLLDLCYMHGSIPSDRRAISRLLGCDGRAISQLIDSVLVSFYLRPDGRYGHKRCDEILDKLHSFQEVQKKNANKRWENEKDAVAVPARASTTSTTTYSSTSTNKTPIVPFEGTLEFFRTLGWKGIRETSDKACSAIADLPEKPFLDCDPTDLESPAMIHHRLGWFEDFWALYWRLVDKKKARIAYFKRVLNVETHEAILDAVQAQSAEMLAKEEKFRPHPTTWLNGERWNDQPAADEDLFGMEAASGGVH